jgi:hypothetical protein
MIKKNILCALLVFTFSGFDFAQDYNNEIKSSSNIENKLFLFSENLNNSLSYCKASKWRFKENGKNWIPWETTNVEMYFFLSDNIIKILAAQTIIFKIIDKDTTYPSQYKTRITLRAFHNLLQRHCTLTIDLEKLTNNISIHIKDIDSEIEYYGKYQ